MKASLTATLILALAFCARSFGALGNNESQVEILFGAPVTEGIPDDKGVTTNLYEKGNYVILVQFLNHLSLAESYTRTDQHDFAQKEIDAFLEGSSNGRPWIKDPKGLAWERSDHKAKAWCTTVRERPTLFIQAK